MLFFQENLQTNTGGSNEPSNVDTSKGYGAIEQLEQLETAFKSYVASVTDLQGVIKNVTKQLTTMEDSSLSLQKSMGGYVINADKFRQTLQDATFDNLDLNATFKDSLEIVGGLAEGMGEMVNPSKEVVSQAIILSKSMGETNQNIGKMIADFSIFGGTQKEATDEIERLSKSARKSGLDAKTYTKEVAKNLDQASRYGFSKGIEDIEKVVKKTKLLKTSLESLGIGAAAEGLLDPEKALETASSIQMIGGNIGALGDPFQLLYMGQKDMKKLTDEVLNMAKATYTFDKETGAFTQTTEDMYALKAASQALGVNYEETARAGKELAKLDFIKTKTNLADKIADEDTQNLIAGLAQIDKAGNVSIDLPGLDKSFSSLDDALADPEFMRSLKEYEEKKDLSEKDLAISQMSIAEKQAADVNEIKHAVVKYISGDPQKEKNFIENIKKVSQDEGKAIKGVATTSAPITGEVVDATNAAAAAGAQTAANTLKNIDIQGLANVMYEKIKNRTFTNDDDELGGRIDTENADSDDQVELGQDMFFKKINDGFFDSLGSEPIISTKDGLFKPRLDDQIAVGTSLLDTLMEGEKATNLLLGLTKQNTTTQNETKQEVSGKIEFGEIRIKVDAPNVDTSILEKTLNSKSFTDQIMSMVANQKSYYRNQSTLEG
jgi:hypothetical protein